MTCVTNKPQTAEERLVLSLWGVLHQEGADVTGFLNMLHTVVMRREWTPESFAGFLRDDLQTTPEDLQKIICLTHRNEREKQFDAEKVKEIGELRCRVRDLLTPGLVQPGEIGRNRVYPVSSISKKSGNNADYLIRRLKRDRPDLAERVIKGEMKAKAAAREAGFVEQQHTIPHDVIRAAGVIGRHFTRAEVVGLLRQLKGAFLIGEEELEP